MLRFAALPASLEVQYVQCPVKGRRKDDPDRDELKPATGDRSQSSKELQAKANTLVLWLATKVPCRIARTTDMRVLSFGSQ